MKPLITVVAPTWNRPRLLERSLDSIARQGHRPLEVLVVDDGDGAADTVARWRAGAAFELPAATLDNRGAGQVAARNLGVAQAKGEIVAFLDDDDFWSDSTYLGRVAAALAGPYGAAFASGRIVVEDEAMRLSDSLEFAAVADAKSIRKDNQILISGFAFARRLFAELGPFDASLPYYWDWDWHLRLFAAGVAFADLGEAGICISARGGTVSSAAFDESRRANLDRLAAKHGLGELRLRNHEGIARDRRGGDAPPA